MHLPGERIIEASDGSQWLGVPVIARVQLIGTDAVPAAAIEQVRATASTVAEGEEETQTMYWQDGVNPDLVWCKFILDTEGANKNWDYMPRPTMMAGYASTNYKPMNMEHVLKEDGSLLLGSKSIPRGQNTIFGVMGQGSLAKYDGTVLTPDEIKAVANVDDMTRKPKEKMAVVAYAAMWNFLFPKTVEDIVKAAAKGRLFVSMERWIQEWDFLVRDGDKFKSVARAQAKELGYDQKWASRQMVGGSPVLRRSLKFVYGGVASTTDPANPACSFLAETAVKAEASKGSADPIVKKLIARHSEVERQWVVTSCEDRKQELIAEHTRIHAALAAYLR